MWRRRGLADPNHPMEMQQNRRGGSRGASHRAVRGLPRMRGGWALTASTAIQRSVAAVRFASRARKIPVSAAAAALDTRAAAHSVCTRRRPATSHLDPTSRLAATNPRLLLLSGPQSRVSGFAGWQAGPAWARPTPGPGRDMPVSVIALGPPPAHHIGPAQWPAGRRGAGEARPNSDMMGQPSQPEARRQRGAATGGGGGRSAGLRPAGGDAPGGPGRSESAGEAMTGRRAAARRTVRRRAAASRQPLAATLAARRWRPRALHSTRESAAAEKAPTPPPCWTAAARARRAAARYCASAGRSRSVSKSSRTCDDDRAQWVRRDILKVENEHFG